MGYYNVSVNKAVEADNEDQAVERAFTLPLTYDDQKLIATVKDAAAGKRTTLTASVASAIATAMSLVSIIEKLQADAGEWQYEDVFEVDVTGGKVVPE